MDPFFYLKPPSTYHFSNERMEDDPDGEEEEKDVEMPESPALPLALPAIASAEIVRPTPSYPPSINIPDDPVEGHPILIQRVAFTDAIVSEPPAPRAIPPPIVKPIKLSIAFLCTLTKIIMITPVRASDNHIYEKKCIEAYIKRYNRSPMTHKQILIVEVVFKLKKKIEEYFQQNPLKRLEAESEIESYIHKLK